MTSNLLIQKNCIFCGGVFTAKTLHTRYCSKECNRKHYKKSKREEQIKEYLEPDNKKSTNDAEVALQVQAKEFLSVQETALLLGSSRRTIERLIAKGKLHATKVGSRTIISRSRINQLFNL